MKSCSRRPTGSSAKAVTTAVSRPKQRFRPRATLYSPPPSQTSKERVLAMRFSPGSKRTMISPRLTRSQRHCCFGLICRVTRSLSNNLRRASGDFCRLHFRGQKVNEEERDQVRAAGHQERDHVAAGPLQGVTDHFGDEHAADGAGHAADAYDGADSACRKHVGGQRVKICGETLMRGGGQADYEDRGPEAFDFVRKNYGGDAEGAN